MIIVIKFEKCKARYEASSNFLEQIEESTNYLGLVIDKTYMEAACGLLVLT